MEHNYEQTDNTLLQDAVTSEKINESTIIQYCNNPDVYFKRDGKLGRKGLTRRNVGFYRILGE